MTHGGRGAVWIFKSTNSALGTDDVVVRCGYWLAPLSAFLGHKLVDNFCRVGLHRSRPTAVQIHQHNTSTYSGVAMRGHRG